jgi:DNA-binding NarL/FixJ family response regulator
MSARIATEERVQVALVCDPEALRLGIERMLAPEPAVAVRSHRRLEAVRSPADVAVLCDRGLPDAARACGTAAEQLDAGVVLVASHADAHVLLDCLAAGATGLLTEADSAADLTAAVRAAAAGKYHLGARMLTLLLDWEVGRRRRADSTEEAERALLALLAAGRTTAQIGAELGVTPKTVRNRSSLLYRRLGVRSRAQAVRAAEARGLLDRTPPQKLRLRRAFASGGIVRDPEP